MSEIPLQVGGEGRAAGLRGDERKHGLSTEPVPVSAYVGSSKNLKDLKDATSVCTGVSRPYEIAHPLGTP